MTSRNFARIAGARGPNVVGAIALAAAWLAACGADDTSSTHHVENPVMPPLAGSPASAGQGGGLAGASGAPQPTAGSGVGPIAGTGAAGQPAAGQSGAGAGGGGGMAGAGGAGGNAAGAGGMGGMAGQGGPDEEEDPVCELPDPSEFEPNTSVGGGGSQYEESDHFRIYGSGGDKAAALNHLEAAHKCFVEDWCFRSPGLSVHSDDGPYYKFNVYSVGNLGSAAGVMQYDARAGISYLEVIGRSLADPRVTIHEFGHALTLTEYGWVDQTRTGAWWETVANWVADTYLTSPYCEEARTEFGVATGRTILDLGRNISQSWRVIVDDQNYYQAWPFITYLINNPDNYAGLGRMVLLEMFRNHPGNNETPLHVLERVASPVRVQTILGRYWARMAYLDIEHPQAQQVFFDTRGSLDFANLDSVGNQRYRVKAAKQPRYGGANIIPLAVSGDGNVTIEVTNLGNGRPDSNFTATLAIRAQDGSVRYVDLPDGSGQAMVASNEEASLVVANTPDELIQFDAFQSGAGSPENVGLNYEVLITGATPSP